MNRAKTAKSQDKFQASVDYLAEYTHVRGAVIVDFEGLIVAKKGAAGFDAELFGALGVSIAESINKQISRLFSPGIDLLTLKTHRDWVTIARSSSFFLVVAASRQADDLLSIRISRSLEMISSFLKEKYPNAISSVPSVAEEPAKSMEEINV
jgi:predicted regulator of Ras-like GTPase activity (Roadblock/LC7/MglB family)